MTTNGVRVPGICFLLLRISIVSAFIPPFCLAEEDGSTPISKVTGAAETFVQSGLDRMREFREGLHDWEQSVRGFRSGHHFNVSLGSSKASWKVVKLGPFQNEQFESQGFYGMLNYSFHLPVHQGFGGFLGSSLGSLLESKSSEQLRQADSVQIPGVLFGLSVNFNPALVLDFGFNYYLERWDRIGLRGNDTLIRITSRTFDRFAALDFFYLLNWGIRIEAHLRESEFVPPRGAQGASLDLELSRRDVWIGTGLVYHFL